MAPEERERMNWLCKRIQEEKDQGSLGELISELDSLLAKKEERLQHNGTSNQ